MMSREAAAQGPPGHAALPMPVEHGLVKYEYYSEFGGLQMMHVPPRLRRSEDAPLRDRC
jgi:hypothetical protein